MQGYVHANPPPRSPRLTVQKRTHETVKQYSHSVRRCKMQRQACAQVKRTKKQQVHELVLTQALLVAGSLYKQRQYTNACTRNFLQGSQQLRHEANVSLYVALQTRHLQGFLDGAGTNPAAQNRRPCQRHRTSWCSRPCRREYSIKPCTTPAQSKWQALRWRRLWQLVPTVASSFLTAPTSTPTCTGM